ncbi:MAG TPA: ATP-binding protein [Vicinamibacterales bacterium]|jgi:two-component system sensor histidine kinase QseC|nr:ATP-binding protein [Vicinamibacterales bacterium]
MARPHQRSVRRQLLVLLLTAVSVAWIAAATVSFRDARHDVAEVLDAHLAQTASLISVQRDGDDDDDEVDTEHAPVLHRYSRRVMFQVWKNGMTLGLHSQHAPDTPLSRVRDGFSDTTIGGAGWRVFSTWDAQNRVLVQVAEQNYERDELATAVARNFLVPLAITLPILGLMIWAAVGRATESLTHVNQQVASRAADNLTPLDVADAPSEIGALVTNLNQLFGRVQGLIEQERRFTADAAHELRTPLAGIRAQAQVARGATDDAERARALDGMMAGCDRATHAVEQMLTLARLAPEAVSFQPTAVELGAVLKATIGELAPFALAKHMDIELNDGRGGFVSGDAGLLAILFRNVIDNAIRYSAAGTKVDVGMEITASDVRVTVRDAGRGVPAEQRANVGRRFYRAPGTQAPGSGLGLSIVQRILDLHRGTIRLDTPATNIGLQVTIALPRVVG